MNTETYIPIAQLEPNNTYDQIFMVMSTKEKRAGNGKPFLRVTFKDVTGEISGIIWSNKFNHLQIGDFVRVKMTTKIFNEQTEFHANEYDVTIIKDKPINKHDYIHCISSKILNNYSSEIEAIVSDLQDQIYRDILSNAIHKLDLIAALSQAPYDIDGPMAYEGGLLMHTGHAIRFCKEGIIQAQEREISLNPSLVIAGCILRNIGWYTITKFQAGLLQIRDAFHTIGVYRASSRYIDHLMLACESDLQINIPEEKKQALENMCNEPSNIKTLEGRIVAAADQMANILDFSSSILKSQRQGNWSGELFVGHI